MSVEGMYVRLVQFRIGPGVHAAAERLAAELGPQIQSQDGCQSVTFFGDESASRYGMFVLWDTQENADAAASVIAPQLRRHLAGNVVEEPSRRLFKVIDA